MMLEEQKTVIRAFEPNKQISSWNDVSVSDKNRIRKAPIPSKFAELRITSGSTGEPLYVFYSKLAVDGFLRRAVISLQKSGLNQDDVVLNLFAYGNYIPGSMYERACQIEGLPTIPLGAPNTYAKEKMLETIIKLHPSVWLGVPSYTLTLLEGLARKRKKNSFPRLVIVAGERLLDTTIEKFKKYNIELVNHFGLTECPAIGVSKKGQPKILELINDGIYTESIREQDVEYFVVTDLYNTATPIVRYKTGDTIDNVKRNPNGTISQMSITGRGDDMLKIQGIIVPKSKIVEIIGRFSSSFFVNIKTKNSRDFVEIVVDEKSRKYKQKLLEKLAFLKKWKISFRKKIIIPQTTSFKNRYIIDSRH